MKIDDFQHKWNSVPHANDAFLALPLDHPLDLQIGYGIHGYKSLVVMNSGLQQNIPSSRVIAVDNPEMTDGTRRLEFQLLDDKYEEMFLHLCWDMVTYSNTSNAMQRLINRYIRWQKLLQRKDAGIMSPAQQKGLLGELLCLEDVIQSHGVDDAINAWQGPDGCDQDFVFDNTWIEVKAVTLAAKDVRISSLEQLNQDQDGVLRVYTLEKSPEGKYRHNLVRQIEKVKAQLEASDTLSDLFEMKLYKYGYRQKDKDEYLKTWYRLNKICEYYVTADFPKLTRANVPNAVTECSYNLSFTALAPYRR